MAFAIICLDPPDTKALRASTRGSPHMEYIDGFRRKIVMGGALLDEDGETRVGVVLAIDFPDRKSAEQFIAAEPHNKVGIFESVVIRKVHRSVNFDNVLKTERNREHLRSARTQTRRNAHHFKESDKERSWQTRRAIRSFLSAPVIDRTRVLSNVSRCDLAIESSRLKHGNASMPPAAHRSTGRV
jgi:uncharacterized protein YciI